MRNHRRRTRLFRRLALVFAAALVAVPAAQAYPDEGLRAQVGTFVPGVTDFPGSSYIAPAQAQPQSWPGVDPHAVPSKVVPIQVVPEPESWPGVTGSTEATPIKVVNPDGFSWGDSGIGAGTAFAVILLAAGALLAVRHVGHGHQATA
jgi:hypothetical protein